MLRHPPRNTVDSTIDPSAASSLSQHMRHIKHPFYKIAAVHTVGTYPFLHLTTILKTLTPTLVLQKTIFSKNKVLIRYPPTL